MQFLKFSLNARNIFGPVDAEMRFLRVQHSNFKAVLQRSQLFE